MSTFLLLIVAIWIHSNDSQLTAELRSVLVGGCYDIVSVTLINCAAVEEECESKSGIRFKSARELTELGDLKCSTNEIPLGTCGISGDCAITKDSCFDPAEFMPPTIGGECNAEGKSLNGVFSPTQYGACRDGTTGEITCVLTPEDCTDREAWIPASVASELRNGGCRCHDVLVGVCKDGPNINPMLSDCAISADDCHPLVQTFGTARDVEDHALLDCRLCPYDEGLVGASNLGSLSSGSFSSGSTGGSNVDTQSSESTGGSNVDTQSSGSTGGSNVDTQSSGQTSDEKDVDTQSSGQTGGIDGESMNSELDETDALSGGKFAAVIVGVSAGFSLLFVSLFLFYTQKKRKDTPKVSSTSVPEVI